VENDPHETGTGHLAQFQAEPLLGQRLRALRLDRGWSQQEVAERMADLGFSWRQSTAAKTEAAERPVRLNEAVALAAIFDADLGDLVRPELHPLLVRLQLEASRLAQAEQVLADTEQRRDAERRRVELGRKRVQVLRRASILTAMPAVQAAQIVELLLEVFSPEEWGEVLLEAGAEPDDVEAARAAVDASGDVDDHVRALLIALKLAPADRTA